MTGLPATVTTSTHGLLVICDAQNKGLFTFCPRFGVQRGLGYFDDRPTHFVPSYLELLTAPEDEIVRMKREWDLAARKNVRLAQRYEFDSIDDVPADAELPFIPALGEPSFVADLDESVQTECAAIEEFLSWIEQQDSEIAALEKTEATALNAESKGKVAKGKTKIKRAKGKA